MPCTDELITLALYTAMIAPGILRTRCTLQTPGTPHPRAAATTAAALASWLPTGCQSRTATLLQLPPYGVWPPPAALSWPPAGQQATFAATKQKAKRLVRPELQCNRNSRGSPLGAVHSSRSLRASICHAAVQRCRNMTQLTMQCAVDSVCRPRCTTVGAHRHSACLTSRAARVKHESCNRSPHSHCHVRPAMNRCDDCAPWILRTASNIQVIRIRISAPGPPRSRAYADVFYLRCKPPRPWQTLNAHPLRPLQGLVGRVIIAPHTSKLRP